MIIFKKSQNCFSNLIKIFNANDVHIWHLDKSSTVFKFFTFTEKYTAALKEQEEGEEEDDEEDNEDKVDPTPQKR